MTKLILIIFIMFESLLNYAQNSNRPDSINKILSIENNVIYGIVKDFVLKEPLPGAFISFNNKKTEFTTNENGLFIIPINYLSKNDTIKIQYLGFRTIEIVNLQLAEKPINLGVLDMFQFDCLSPMIDFFCKWTDFRCRFQAWKYWRNFDKNRMIEFKKINKLIENYTYSLNDKKYKYNLKNKIFNNLILDLKNE